jgi:hypothetical protein
MSYVSLWSVGYRVKAALTVTIVATTDKAVQFEGQFKIAHWFSFNEFTRNVFNRYASHY